MSLNTFESIVPWAIIGIAIVSLLYAWWLRSVVLKKDKGTPKMQEVWNAIRIGADAYLSRQLRTILPFIVISAAALFLSVYAAAPTSEATEVFGKDAQIAIAVGRMAAFVLGASFSLIVGQYGMRMAVQANVRVAAASKRSFNESLSIAYYAGTITGMLTDGLGLLGGTSIFIIFGRAAPDALLGFGFGGTLLALFMRVGGGIFTKAADVGADLVGKVEAGMEEDDPRNAAVIADLVGDNVGDCAGMAADMYKSYELSSAITITCAFLLSAFYAHDLRMGVLVAVGVALAVAFNPLTAYATSANSKRVRKISAATRFGPALVILEGLSLGYLSSIWAVVVIMISLAASILIYNAQLPPGIATIALYVSIGLAVVIFLFQMSRKHWIEGIFLGMWVVVAGFFFFSMRAETANAFTYILFGVSLIGVGMLSHTGNNVSMDTFGPISDNANGIGEIAGMDPKARQVMADLDAAGNTTKAITKGVAIGSAVIAALSLY